MLVEGGSFLLKAPKNMQHCCEQSKVSVSSQFCSCCFHVLMSAQFILLEVL